MVVGEGVVIVPRPRLVEHLPDSADLVDIGRVGAEHGASFCGEVIDLAADLRVIGGRIDDFVEGKFGAGEACFGKCRRYLTRYHWDRPVRGRQHEIE